MCALRQRADKGEKRFLQKQSLTTSKKSLELRGDGPKEAARPLPAACGHSQARAVPVLLGLEPQGPVAGEPDLDSSAGAGSEAWAQGTLGHPGGCSFLWAAS